MSKKSVAQGYVIHEDSQRVVIATGFKRKSSNAKTGPMIQVWILNRNVNPLEAIKTGENSVICGQCPAMSYCYVDVGKAPMNIWKTYRAGKYPVLTDDSVFSGRMVRWGAYGDPAFIPYAIVERVSRIAAGWTGYTHQWRNPLFAAYKRFVMASVESVEGFNLAQSQGWRTFRVTKKLEHASNEITCVNTTRGVSCHDCGLCNGTETRAKSIVIEVHGAKKGKLVA